MYLSSLYCFHSHSCLVWKDNRGYWNYARKKRENGNLVQKYLQDFVNFSTVSNNQPYPYTKQFHFTYTKYGQQGWRLQPSSCGVCIILKYAHTPETTVQELTDKWKPSGKKKYRRKRKRKYVHPKRCGKKRKLLGLRYFNGAQRTVKENKTGPGSGLAGGNARIKLFWRIVPCTCQCNFTARCVKKSENNQVTVGLGNVARKECSLMHS